MSSLIDQLLSDFTPDSDAGIQRGQDIKAISDAEDTGLLSELAPGEHNQGSFAGTGVLAAREDWHESAATPFTREDSISNDILKDASEQSGGRHPLTAAQVKMRISALLHLGKTPKQVTAYLDKLAEAAVFDRTLADESLKASAGLEGMAYIEPNHFNKSCVASLRHIKQHGQLKAASVKRIAACAGCENCKSDHDGGCKCATYGLPIVSDERGLKNVVAKLTKGSMKRASLVARHNGEQQELKQARVAATEVPARAESKTAGHGSIQRFDIEKARETLSSFTPKQVQASINGGQTLQQVYVTAKKAHGSAKTEKVVRTYLDGLKKTGARINLAAIDCSLLKKRLTASETIIGKKACATCTHRCAGMHCGFTGGTLLSFPGMEQAVGSKRAAAQAQVQDGVQFMQQMELQAPVLEFQIKGDRDLLQVEL